MTSNTLPPSSAAASPLLRSISELPGPPVWPVVGNLFQLDRARVHQTVEQWCNQYGPVFQMKLGPTRFVVVCDHEAIGAVLRDRPDGFRRPPRLEVVWREMGLAPGVFGANGDAWRRQRRMVMAGFDPGHVRAYFPSLSRVTQRLRKRWMKAAHSASVIDLQSDLMRFTVDAIAGLAFGSEINTLESDEEAIQQHLDKIFPAVSRRMLSPLPYWRYLRLPAARRLERGVLAVNAAVQTFIGKARQRLEADPQLRQSPANLLEAMIMVADQTDSGLDDSDVAGNVLTMLLAGEDTTANTLAWMLHLLQRNPAALQRVQDEVRSVAGEGGPDHVFTQDQLALLDYVEACAHETMRLKPVGPVNLVQALRDTTVSNVRIPAGGMVWLVMRHDSVHQTHFANPGAFEPQRWLAPSGAGPASTSAKRVSMPFGAGPRVCPGRYLALLEMKMAMAMLFNSFDIESVATADGAQPLEHLSFTMAPVGLKMRLRERR